MVGFFAESCVNLVVENDLGYAVAVADIDKCHTAHLADALHPSGYGHGLTGIGEP